MKQQNIKASFFFTGDFYRKASFKPIIQQLKKEGHYLGAHSDKHLLYADWNKRDSLLVTKEQFKKDLLQNYTEMKQFGISKANAAFFLPPYEWYQSIIRYEQSHSAGLNGFILLVHIGTDPKRTDKFYLQLPKLLKELKQKGYQFKRVDELLNKR